MFSILWPLMPLACMIINFLKVRADGYRLCKTLKVIRVSCFTTHTICNNFMLTSAHSLEKQMALVDGEAYLQLLLILQ